MKQEKFRNLQTALEQMSLFQEELTSLSEEPRASRSPSQATDQDCAECRDLHSPIADFLRQCVPAGSYGKMYQAFSVQTEGRISKRFSKRLMKSGILAHGECWTLNMSEWTDTLVPFRKEDDVCSLSDILVPISDVPQEYYLSRKSCSGLLRRAEARGRALPDVLQQVLVAQAGKNSSIPSSAETEDR